MKNMSASSSSSSSSDKQSALLSAWIRFGRRPRQVSLIIVSLVCLLAALEAPRALEALELTKQSSDSGSLKQQQQQQQHNSDKDSSAASARAKLEAELDAIVQQQHEPGEFSDRSLADAIISRLMGENLATELTPPTATESEIDELLMSAGADSAAGSDAAEQQQQQLGSYLGRSYSGPEALKLKKLLSMAQAYEALLNGAGQLGYAGPPMLPASPAATSKRASKLASNYLQQRQLTGTGTGGASGATGYGRSSFDFGLGKRPDTAGAASNILRFGDSLSGGGGAGVQGVNQFGKRPSAHRYDFGLGKRVASSAYPRYDFGLGKRAPSRIRYDFGLGK